MSTDSAARRAFRSKVDSIRPTFGFEDVSLAPGTDTVDPADVDLSAEIGGIGLPIPVLAAAMDAVVDARFAGALAALGGLAVLNLEGVQARFDDPDFVLERIATAPDADLGDVLAEAYGTPLREDLVARRIAEIVRSRNAEGKPAVLGLATTGHQSKSGPDRRHPRAYRRPCHLGHYHTAPVRSPHPSRPQRRRPPVAGGMNPLARQRNRRFGVRQALPF